MYSLRHTAIMFRLTESQGLDLLSLARNARTSVEMIDRFYAKHLTAEMNVELIQSNRNDSLRATSDLETLRLKSESVEAKRSSKQMGPARMPAKKLTAKKSSKTREVEKNVK